MKFLARLIVPVAVFSMVAIWGATSSAVLIGQSALIGDLDYADSFTLTGTNGASSSQRVNGLAPGFDQPAGTNLNLEQTFSNPVTSWAPARLRFFSGADTLVGTNDDFALTGEVATFGYGLRSNYVLQVDAQLTGDRFNFTTSPISTSAITAAGAISIFIRPTDVALPSVGIFKPGEGELDTLLDTGILNADNSYHNFAVNFNHVDNLIEVFVDELSIGIVDLDTFDGGAYSLPAGNAQFVGVGGSVEPMDNFQVGSVAVVPEPASIALWSLLGLSGFGLVLRHQRRSC
jgi:hypothetical protein